MVRVFLPSNNTLRQKLVLGVGHCYERPDHAFVRKNLEHWDFALEKQEILVGNNISM